jgi:hypothetical protein
LIERCSINYNYGTQKLGPLDPKDRPTSSSTNPSMPISNSAKNIAPTISGYRVIFCLLGQEKIRIDIFLLTQANTDKKNMI